MNHVRRPCSGSPIYGSQVGFCRNWNLESIRGMIVLRIHKTHEQLFVRTCIKLLYGSVTLC
jgi:hypothetical protein